MIYWPFDSVVTDDGQGNVTYDRAFDSANLRKIFKMLYTNGVAMTDSSDALQVIPGTDMTVAVKAGAVIIEGAMGKLEEAETVSLEAANATYGRIDAIVARLNTNISARSIEIIYIKGTETAVPVAPEIVRSGGIYDLRLANIRIPAGASAITAAMITDTRLGEECGVATARPQTVDTASIFDQYQASLDEYMEYVQDCINETTAGSLQQQINDMQNTSVSGSLASQINDLQTPVDENSADLKFIKLRGHKHIHEAKSAATKNQYVALATLTLPANNTGYDIVYRLIGTCTSRWSSNVNGVSVTGSVVGLSIWGTDGYGTANNHIGREIIDNHPIWDLGMRSIVYISMPNGSDARNFYLYLRHSVANAPLADIDFSYEAFMWEKASES